MFINKQNNEKSKVKTPMCASGAVDGGQWPTQLVWNVCWTDDSV